MDQFNKDRLLTAVIEAVTATMRNAPGDIEDKCLAAIREFPGLPNHVLVEARLAIEEEIEAPFWKGMAERLNFQTVPAPARRSYQERPNEGKVDDQIPF